MPAAELIVLGSGDSAGTPRAGNFWGRCDPAEPKNIRTRPSVCLKTDRTCLVVDTGPDFKQQVNRENIPHIDGVIYTHAHADHVNGIDDLKPYYDRTKSRVPIYLTDDAFATMKTRFNYLFEQETALYPSIVEATIWRPADLFSEKTLGDIHFTPFPQSHGIIDTLGIRCGDVAYSTDVIDLDPQAVDLLKGVRTWIVDGANLYHENPIVHLNLKKILLLNEQIGAERIYLTHMKYDLDYKTLITSLPDGVEPAYDGLRLEVDFK